LRPDSIQHNANIGVVHRPSSKPTRFLHIPSNPFQRIGISVKTTKIELMFVRVDSSTFSFSSDDGDDGVADDPCNANNIWKDYMFRI
jgi:hypothetical protein